LTLLPGAIAPLPPPRYAMVMKLSREVKTVLAKGNGTLLCDVAAALRDRTLLKGYLTLKILQNVRECLSADMA
jgi:hypothetical protein